MAKKKTTKSKAGAPVSAVRFFQEARDELKKVTWPSREATFRYTIIVIIASLAVGGVIGGIDYVFTWLLERIII